MITPLTLEFFGFLMGTQLSSIQMKVLLWIAMDCWIDDRSEGLNFRLMARWSEVPFDRLAASLRCHRGTLYRAVDGLVRRSILVHDPLRGYRPNPHFEEWDRPCRPCHRVDRLS